jgi:hypothetical protein
MMFPESPKDTWKQTQLFCLGSLRDSRNRQNATQELGAYKGLQIFCERMKKCDGAYIEAYE